MALWYRILADAVVVVHFAYVAFVLFGQLAILIGILAKWEWVRKIWFRGIHLVAIVVVVLEAWWGVTCPLTTWEQDLRAKAGQEAYTGDFIATCAHDLLFMEAEPWVFTLCYSIFGALVLLTFFIAPPRRKKLASGAQASDLR
jgi:hypothetical protein